MIIFVILEVIASSVLSIILTNLLYFNLPPNWFKLIDWEYFVNELSTLVLSVSVDETKESLKYTLESSSTYKIFKSTIFWVIPDTVYCFNFDNIWFFEKSETKLPFLGFILITTVPNSGGLSSSPPTTETDSVFG